jgi:hypothetical protein
MAVLKDWRKHRRLQSLLQDHFPGEWANISRCRMAYKPLESVQRPGHYKVAPIYACWELPFCIRCVKASTHRRVMAALDKYHRCTPKGQSMQLFHIVQTAPIYDDGTGWGVEASSNLKAFGNIVWENLQEFYGEGIGAIMSYQDFGERLFAKRHPHMDLTLNGWMLKDGQPAKTPKLNLQGGGRARWDNALVQRATRFRVDAKRGSLDVSRVIDERAIQYKVLRYQMRELVNLRQVQYNRDRQTVTWHAYSKDRDVPTQTTLTVHEFKAGLAEYQWRLKQWPQGEDEGMELHRAYGHIAKRSVRKTQKAMGGVPMPHDELCPCAECGDWERVFLDDFDVQAGLVHSLNEVHA